MRDRKLLDKFILEEKRNEDEENFDEAIAASFRACKQTEIPSEISIILNDPKAMHLDVNVSPFPFTALANESATFWILASALGDFVKQEGTLPLMGSLPDMKADSNRYIQLQNWHLIHRETHLTKRSYRNKFKRDVSIMTSNVRQILSDLNRPQTSISATTIEAVCKNASTLRLIRYHPIEEEYTTVDAPTIGILSPMYMSTDSRTRIRE